MIWIVAIVFLALFGFLGYLQGAVRGGFALFGALLGAILALPLARFAKPVVGLFGFENPLWLQILPPVFVFLLITIIATVAGVSVHQKISIYFQYKATETERLRFERLEERVGLPVGLVQGAFYFFLLMIPIYMLSSFTKQVESPEDSFMVRFVNGARNAIQAARLDRVVAGLDPSPKWYIEAADVIGRIYKNPILAGSEEAPGRLWRYPTLLSFADRTEFQTLASDEQFPKLLERQASFSEIIRHEPVHAIVTDPALSRELADAIKDDLGDLYEFLGTGKSPKYAGEKILGVWTVELAATIAEERKRRPGVSALELNRIRRALASNFRGATLTATPDNQFVLNKPADPSMAHSPRQVLARGTWQRHGRNYQAQLTEPKADTADVTIIGEDRLTLTLDGFGIVFEREI